MESIKLYNGLAVINECTHAKGVNSLTVVTETILQTGWVCNVMVTIMQGKVTLSYTSLVLSVYIVKSKIQLATRLHEYHVSVRSLGPIRRVCILTVIFMLFWIASYTNETNTRKDLSLKLGWISTTSIARLK